MNDVTHRIGYARVSTRSQSLDDQVEKLTAQGCQRVFTDVASGARDDRPGLADCLAYLRRGDALVITKLDRLGRSLRHLIDLAAELQDRGVQLISLGDAIDTSTSAGRMVFNVFGAIAEFERELIHERVMHGLDHARAQGRRGGRPTVMTPEMIATAQTLVAVGTPVLRISRTFGVSRGAVARALREAAGA